MDKEKPKSNKQSCLDAYMYFGADLTFQPSENPIQTIKAPRPIDTCKSKEGHQPKDLGIESPAQPILSFPYSRFEGHIRAFSTRMV